MEFILAEGLIGGQDIRPAVAINDVPPRTVRQVVIAAPPAERVVTARREKPVDGTIAGELVILVPDCP
jgi:hypothetical protein